MWISEHVQFSRHDSQWLSAMSLTEIQTYLRWDTCVFGLFLHSHQSHTHSTGPFLLPAECWALLIKFRIKSVSPQVCFSTSTVPNLCFHHPPGVPMATLATPAGQGVPASLANVTITWTSLCPEAAIQSQASVFAVVRVTGARLVRAVPTATTVTRSMQRTANVSWKYSL